MKASARSCDASHVKEITTVLSCSENAHAHVFISFILARLDFAKEINPQFSNDS